MKRHAYRHILHSLCALTLVLSVGFLALPEEAPVAAPVEQTLAGRVVAVDAGHGGYDGGARAPCGRWEKVYNLTVAKALQKELEARGAQVVMTREGDYALCDKNPPIRKKRQDMERRAALVLGAGAEMLVSIHMNEYRVRSESGPQVFYRAGSGAGRLLAGTMQEALITALSPQKERAAMPGDYFILQLDTPSVLVECGFISNPAEEALLLSPAYQEKLGEAIADGAAEYFRLAQAEK